MRVRFRVTARGGVAVTMRAAMKAPNRCTLGPKHWEDELLKSRLNAIRKAVRDIELVENCNRSADAAQRFFSHRESTNFTLS